MNSRTFLALLTILVAACSGAGETVTVDVAPSDGKLLDGGHDALTQEVVGLEEDLGSPEDLREPHFDLIPEELTPQCQAGDGCFLDPCTSNEQCLSGWCVDHMGAGVCTQTCSEECPAGWSCKPLGAAEPDLLYLCVSDHANLCRPCGTGDNCKSVSGAEDVCLDYGDEGSFCGGACANDEDCPWGFSCDDTHTVDGIPTKQCVADAGVCPCTEKSVALALWTPCTRDNEFGACTGKRVCTENGLSDCDAANPAPELCNGADDNCDGDVDELTCDDDNPCTQDTCNGTDGCAHSPLTQGECLDQDACTIGDHCQDGVCVGSPIACDDDNPCTDDECDGLGGCQFTNNTAACDDADPCTVGDTCADGKCTGYAVTCDCQENADCAALEDGDMCNGTLFCNTVTLPYQCDIVDATVITCPAPTGPDAFCLASHCDPLTGACSLVPDHDGLACDDGNLCTIGDVCDQGTCVSGVPTNCADNNPCTDDSCEPATGCLHTPNAAPCNDGDACTVDDQCTDGMCVAGVPASCDDNNPCTDDGCLPATGCTHQPNAAPCDDQNACTTGDQCKAGACSGTGLKNCNDNNICTDDQCDPELGCTTQPNSAPCDDGDPCTLNDQCAGGLCQAGPSQLCDDGNPCTADSCGESGACLHTPTEGPCDDGNACTVGESCDQGKCLSIALLNCDDDDVCTTDSCAPATGCIHALNKAPCDDQDVCTTGDHCHLGECISSGSLTCNDNNLCTDDACDAQVGCTFMPNSNPCDDGEVCTTGDACGGGTCQPGEPTPCDDQNPCTTDSCQMGVGCIFTPNDLLCDDANACTTGEFCAGGVCDGGVEVVCSDGNVCTDDSCHVATGCIFTANTAACDDADACTTEDTCLDKSCVGGPPLVCDDDNPCTNDACDADSGCIAPPVEDGTVCGQDLVCNGGVCGPACQSGSVTFSYTGSVQTFVVPACGTTLTIDATGAQGGNSFNHNNSLGGKGGHVQSKLIVPPGATLYLTVGEMPVERDGGFGGGGDGVQDPGQPTWIGAGGGGASDIRLSGQSLSDRILVAAGGGGACPNTPSDFGGVGGGLNGGSGNSNSPGSEGKGASQSAGGAGGTRSGYLPGQQGSSGQGGKAGANTAGGGGGGGWFGGGGGSWGGGGGGSSWVKPDISSNVTNTPGYNSGHGKIVVSW